MSLRSQLECTPELSTNCCVHAKSFRHGNINTLVMVYSALFNNVFKALNFFKNTVALIQLPGNGMWLLSVPQRFYSEIYW